LKHHWVVLRGDEERIQITPQNESGSVVEIAVSYHGRRPVAAGSKLESNRVDIGAFVHNGKYYSAPAFVTFFSLDHESRTYDNDGRPIEIGYGRGQPKITVADWAALLEAAASDAPAGRLLQLEKDQRELLLKAAPTYESLRDAVTVSQKESQRAAAQRGVTAKNRKAAAGQRDVAAKSHSDKPTAETKKRLNKANAVVAAADAARKKADEGVRAERKRVLAATGQLNEFLDAQRSPLRSSIRAFLRARINNLIENPNFANDHAKTLEQLLDKADKSAQASIHLVRQRLIGLRIIGKSEDTKKPLEFTPIREGSTPLAQRLTAYERTAVRHLNAILLTSLIYPKLLTASFCTNYVDPRISPLKHWRDVYQYDSQGNCTGWTRYHPRRQPVRYNAKGMMVLETDDLGRCAKARTVKYIPDPKARDPRSWPSTIVQPGDEIIVYEYKDKDDRIGKIKSRTRVNEKGS